MTLPFDDRDGYIWYNGEFINWRDAKVHILNHGLHYASSVFEGCRVYNGKVFKLREHNERFKKSANILGFEIPYTVEELDDYVNQTVKKQNIIDGYVRPVAWRGSEKMKIYSEGISVHTAIACWQWPAYFSEDTYKNGINICWAKWKRPSPETAPTAAKAAGLYMICTSSKQMAEEAGYHDALMLDYRGYLAEATGANLFLIIDGEIHTPTPDCFLDGITRRTVIDIAKEKGYKVIERHIMPEELAKAQEVFITGTAAEITPVGSIGEYKFKPAEITEDLRSAYHELVRK